MMFSATVSVASFLLNGVGQLDNSNIYLVLAFKFDGEDAAYFDALGLQEIGPERAMLSRMFLADTDAHTTLVRSGYLVVPASAIAAICGVEP